jgi:ATP-dependent Clp protease ATP-binding subunit ClpX
MEKKIEGINTALFCCMCGISTEQGHEIGRVFFRSFAMEKKPCSAICGECVSDAFSVINKKGGAVISPNPQSKLEQVITQKEKKPKIEKIENPYKKRFLPPSAIFSKLSKSIVGQDKAKKSVATALSWHMQKIIDPSIQKTNLLILGPTGTGKTELARSASKILDIPFVVVDATTFTAHGYVGEDVESCLTRLLQAADYNVDRAQNGIVFIDEIDKIADKGTNSFVGTTAVQQSLLKILEGTIVNVPKKPRSRPDQVEYVQMDTSKILFICAGAFSDLMDSKEKKSKRIGLMSNTETENPTTDLFESLSQKDFVSYGLIPEFLGRFQIVTNTVSLRAEDLVRILKESDQSPLIQYKKMFGSYNIEVSFSDQFLHEVANEALASGFGARGLKRALEKRLESALFDLPDSNLEKKSVIF